MHALAHAARELRDGLTEHARQQQRTQEAHDDAKLAEAASTERQQLAEEARIRLQTLRESVGARVEELQQRLMQARQAVQLGEAQRKACDDALRASGEARARAEQEPWMPRQHWTSARRRDWLLMGRLQGFAATGLLLVAMPDAEVPALQTPWTIEAALALARRTDQALATVRDDDDAWNRVQGQISQDYTELGR